MCVLLSPCAIWWAAHASCVDTVCHEVLALSTAELDLLCCCFAPAARQEACDAWCGTDDATVDVPCALVLEAIPSQPLIA